MASHGENSSQNRKNYAAYLSSIEEILEEARNGRMVILVDDEGRENEGDLILPASLVTPESVNFMATSGRGLVCLALTEERAKALELPLMQRRNSPDITTAFALSIEARHGVTTGISAPDRARTIQTAIDPTKSRQDLVTPGHVFPVVARAGGVLVRAGHTEAAVDIARLSGFDPSGVICEVMREDGGMARLPDLVAFAQFHGLKIASIARLIEHRLKTETLVERIDTELIDSAHGGEFQCHHYRNLINGEVHLALVKEGGDPAQIPLVRMHRVNIQSDILGDAYRPGTSLPAAMRAIAEHGRGAVVLLHHLVTASGHPPRIGERDGLAPDERTLREYGIGAQILRDLGLARIVLLTSHPRRIPGLKGFGIEAEGARPAVARPTPGLDRDAG